MKYSFIALILLTGLHCYGQSVDTPHHPFPQYRYVHYQTGTILPDVDMAQMAKTTETFYDSWKAKYMDTVNETMIRIVCKPGEKDYFVAEGQGYGMMIVVMMAGHDPSARERYNKLYNYYNAHRCPNGSHLMVNQQPQYGTTKDTTSATDGDLDIAYSLLLADAQWGSNGPIKYDKAALAMISDIMAREINSKKWSILLSSGDDSGSKRNEYNATRPSDFMPAYLHDFNKLMPGKNWDKVIAEEYSLLRQLQYTYSSACLVPDFIEDVDLTPKPARKHYIPDEKLDCGTYNYNACRVPWRVALDCLQNGNPDAKYFLSALNSWMQTAADTLPRHIYAGYQLNGTPIRKNDKLHLSYITPLAVSAMIDKSNQKWLNRLWDYMTTVTIQDYVNDENFGYYDNSIKLLNMIILSGNYWKL